MRCTHPCVFCRHVERATADVPPVVTAISEPLGEHPAEGTVLVGVLDLEAPELEHLGGGRFRRAASAFVDLV